MPGSRHPKVVPMGEGGVLHWGVTSWVPRRGGGHAGMPVSQLYPTFPAPTAGVRRWLILSWLPPLYITLWILGSAAGTQPGSPTSVHGRARACKTSSGFSVLPSRGAGCFGLQQSLRRRQLFSVFSFLLLLLLLPLLILLLLLYYSFFWWVLIFLNKFHTSISPRRVGGCLVSGVPEDAPEQERGCPRGCAPGRDSLCLGMNPSA